MNSADCTILIPTSPIPSHPTTTLIDEVVAAARFWLPEAPIVIMADGIWEGVKHRRRDYEDYLARLKNRYTNMTLTGFAEHSSQAKMTRMVIEARIVKTRYILFNEHDIPLRTDIKIDWSTMFELLQSIRADVIRLSGFHEGIHPEHERFVHGIQNVNGSTFYQTRQWSQWPHLSSRDFYLQILGKHFDPKEIKMIEERMHGVCQQPEGAYIHLWEYVPAAREDGTLDGRCFIHREGRAGDACHWQ